MSHNLKKCIDILSLVAKIKNPRLRNKILKDITCDDEILGCFCEIAHNFEKGNIHLQDKALKKLANKRTLIQKLAKLKPCKTNARHRNIVNQIGAGWGLIIPIVASIISLLKK